ncbi:MAG: hypothetical protein ABSG87_00530 [Verrucomicrobiota bacterium]|jgi:hypothetical protein
MNPAALIATIKVNLLRRPLWHPATVEECLDIQRPKLTALLDSGELPWAWNLGAGRARKELRILAHCVVERVMGELKEIGATRNLKLPEVVNLILPQKREALRSVEIQRLFHCRADMLRDLHKAGEIKKVSENLPGHGPNASPRFTRESLAALLEKRRIT